MPKRKQRHGRWAWTISLKNSTQKHARPKFCKSFKNEKLWNAVNYNLPITTRSGIGLKELAEQVHSYPDSSESIKSIMVSAGFAKEPPEYFVVLDISTKFDPFHHTIDPMFSFWTMIGVITVSKVSPGSVPIHCIVMIEWITPLNCVLTDRVALGLPENKACLLS